MKYNFIETNDLKSEFLKRHKSIDLNAYNDDYDFNINEECINSFYDKLLCFKDNNFLIVGDYDCDGICSVSIIRNLFKNLNIKHKFYIPSRLKEGYGLNKLIVDTAKKNNIDVLLLVDNGVTCNEAIDYAYQNNIKVFIIDHHKFENKPRCEAFLHQDLLSEEFKYASAGELCFLLSLKYSLDNFNLALCGLTILSDYILINSFNRFILSKTLNILNNNHYKCFELLNESSEYSTYSLTFNIIPKINSVSRMENDKFNANHVVNYLLSIYPNLDEIALYMNKLNSKRKNDSNKLFNDIISNKYDSDYIFICSKDINEGYCSSLATKLANHLDKTVFVLNENNGVCKGSCRSQNLDIHKLLSNYNNFVSFGGHEHAIGLSILSDNINDFVKYLDSLDYAVDEESCTDVYIFNPYFINQDLLNVLDSLGPFGNGYEMPLIGFINNNFKTIILKEKYTKFIINDKLSAITFEEKYLGYKPKYIFGNLNKDNYNKDAFSIIIKALY